MCTDSAENTIKLPNGNLSETLGSGTLPVAMTNTPPIRGDSSSPCVGPNCVDKRIYGWWASPTIVDATGGPQGRTVTERLSTAARSQATSRTSGTWRPRPA